MSQHAPDPHPEPVSFAAAPVVLARRPAAVTAACVVMLVLAAIGGVAAAVRLVVRVIRVARFGSDFFAVFWLNDFRSSLLPLALCVVASVLAIGMWQGSSVARLGAFAALGTAATTTAAVTASNLASVVYGLDQLYEDDWREALIMMWVYLFATMILAAPIPLLNRPKATKWFQRRRFARSLSVTADPIHRPDAITLVRTALVVLAVLTLIAKGWHTGMIMSGELIGARDISENIIRSLAAVIIPLLILTAAIIEIGAGSRLGQTTAFMAGGYAAYQALERLPYLLSGYWFDSWQQFGPLFTTTAMGGVGAVTLFLLLRPRVVNYLVYQSVDLEPDYELAAEYEDDD